jgi:glucosyl-3-phosphoglycerate phosphatase
MILLRHGQSTFNAVYGVTRIDPGIIDPELTDLGRSQAAAAADTLVGRRVARILTSPYTRALQTAEIIAERLSVPVEVSVDVRERYAFVCDIGSPRSHLASRWPELEFTHLPERWWPTQEEPEHELGERARNFRTLMAQAQDWPEVAIVTHWGFIRALTGHEAKNAEMVPFDPVLGSLRPLDTP